MLLHVITSLHVTVLLQIPPFSIWGTGRSQWDGSGRCCPPAAGAPELGTFRWSDTGWDFARWSRSWNIWHNRQKNDYLIRMLISTYLNLTCDLICFETCCEPHKSLQEKTLIQQLPLEKQLRWTIPWSPWWENARFDGQTLAIAKWSGCEEGAVSELLQPSIIFYFWVRFFQVIKNHHVVIVFIWSTSLFFRWFLFWRKHHGLGCRQLWSPETEAKRESLDHIQPVVRLRSDEAEEGGVFLRTCGFLTLCWMVKLTVR